MTEIRKDIVLVDMDGVLADFDAAALACIESRHPDFVRRSQRTNFYIAQDYEQENPEHAAVLDALACEPGFFADLPVARGAFEGWQRILDLGYRPQICTSPVRINPTCREEKLQWLSQHFAPVFGQSVVSEALVTSDKHLSSGIALIDDRPDIRLAEEADWQHIVYDQPYNQHIERLRLRGWDDPALPEILDTARRLGDLATR